MKNVELTDEEVEIILEYFELICQEYPCSKCGNCKMTPLKEKLEKFVGGNESV